MNLFKITLVIPFLSSILYSGEVCDLILLPKFRATQSPIYEVINGFNLNNVAIALQRDEFEKLQKNKAPISLKKFVFWEESNQVFSSNYLEGRSLSKKARNSIRSISRLNKQSCCFD